MASGFAELFRTMTGREPYDYQRRLAEEACADGPKSLAINVPTGAGKTAAAGDGSRDFARRSLGDREADAVATMGGFRAPRSAPRPRPSESAPQGPQRQVSHARDSRLGPTAARTHSDRTGAVLGVSGCASRYTIEVTVGTREPELRR